MFIYNIQKFNILQTQIPGFSNHGYISSMLSIPWHREKIKTDDSARSSILILSKFVNDNHRLDDSYGKSDTSRHFPLADWAILEIADGYHK